MLRAGNRDVIGRVSASPLHKILRFRNPESIMSAQIERLGGGHVKIFIVTSFLCLSFAFSANAQTESFWSASTLPAHTTGNDNSSVELGLRFASNVSGKVTGARVYCATNSSGTHSVHLWNPSRTSLASATLGSCSGWTNVTFATAVAITAGSTYTISYH